jgi:hypothetical protein
LLGSFDFGFESGCFGFERGELGSFGGDEGFFGGSARTRTNPDEALCFSSLLLPGGEQNGKSGEEERRKGW